MMHKDFERILNKHEDGFTLIEILVVILIIGILAAIAIPVFLNQRQTSNDGAVKSDVRNVAMVVETYFTDNPTATTIDANYVRANAKKSEGVTITGHGSRDDFCISGTHVNGKQYRSDLIWQNGQRPYYIYSSLNGGEARNNTPLGNMSCNTAGPGFSWV